MKKIIIIGCPGSGKTTFAQKLSDKSRLPLFYLDAIWHKPDRTHISRDEFDARLGKILSLDEWIIDGNYSRTLERRIAACDTVILFDLPTDVCLEGAVARIGKKRPDMPFPIEEQEGVGTFIMSSKDMCMIEHIPELMKSGIASFKIEGRMKSAYYTAVVTNAYRMAIDAYERDPEGYRFDPAWLSELESVSHREYGTGFYFDNPLENPQLVSTCGYLREKAYFSTATEYIEEEAQAIRAEAAPYTKEAIRLVTEGVWKLCQ